MADSDGEFVADDLSSDDLADHNVGRRGAAADSDSDGFGDGNSHGAVHGGARHSRRAARKKKKARDEQASWETVKRSWDVVDEGDDGRLVGGLESLEAEKRRRLLRDTTPLQRGIIRHLVLVLDMSEVMADRDYLPTYHRAVIKLAVEFVREFFEQNPISQLGIMAMRDGVGVRVSDLSGDPVGHVEALRKWEDEQPQGHPSLQNALEMCRAALFNTPSHGTREILIVYGALLSSDPTDIHDTIDALVTDRIQVSIVGLAAQVAICTEICARTNGGDASTGYAVALDAPHCRELLLAATTPPAASRTAHLAGTASLLMMGFPSRTLLPAVAAKDRDKDAPRAPVEACACHARPMRESYPCTRCGVKVCRLPAECPACGLVLILSTHLARSYHHLFPLRNWVEVAWADAARSRACFACLAPFPEPRGSRGARGKSAKARGKEREGAPAAAVEPLVGKGVSESGRYACEVCGNHFCIDCDVYAHEMVHNCPGCQSETRGSVAQVVETNGEQDGAMVID